MAVSPESAPCPPQYAYCGWSGPQQWANIPGSQCGATKQSPVDIKGWRTERRGPVIQVSYVGGAAQVVNTGHDIEVIPASADNAMSIGGKRYSLKQFHFHTPSEHSILGRPFPAEVHFVHELDGKIAVIAVMLPVDRSHSVLEPIFRDLPKNVCSRSSAWLDLRNILPRTIDSYYTYEGSLTTPPCSEGVTFYIANGTGLMLSRPQHDALTSLGPNARPLQPINNRTITLVEPR